MQETGRAIWRGVLSLGGLITVPVRLYTAVREQRVNFHLLHDADRVRLSQRLVCPADGEVVDRQQTVKGFALERDRYVLVSAEELELLTPQASRSVEILASVPAAQIDPRYFARPYLLGPDTDGDSKKYLALVQALARVDRVAICRWVMRKKDYWGALRAHGKALFLVTMRQQDEIVCPDVSDITQIEANERERETAKYLVNMLADSFQPQNFKDQFQDELRELIMQKARGEEPSRPRAVPAIKATESDQLMAALEESVKQAQRRKVGS